MKAILITSIHGKKYNYDAVQKIIAALQKKVILYSDHITEMTQERLNSLSEEENYDFHKNILNKISQSDIVVSECSYQSLSVGYLLSYAVELAKPVIIFFHTSQQKPNLFPTLANKEEIYIVEYDSLEEIPELVKVYLDYAKEKVEVRFNLFLSPRINRYLKWIGKRNQVSKSTFVRDLMMKHLEENSEYIEE